MTLDIVRGTGTKPAASRALVDALEEAPNLAGRLFIGFPIIRTATGPQAVDALWLSKEKGIVVFDLVEADDLGDYQARQDDIFNAIEGHLRLDRRLVHRRNLRIPVNAVSFAPQCIDPDEDGYPVLASANVVYELAKLDGWYDSCSDAYKAALSALENVSTIRRSSRSRPRAASRAAKLRQLEDAIATLDPWQSRAVVETIEGVQRIRGLAGSGKTIVLALKAAYLHTLHPEWLIAITFYTRSLKDTFRRLVRDFHIRYAGEEPDWSRLEVVNAWGTRRGDGIYSEFCRKNGIDYLDFSAAKLLSQSDPFAGACERALADVPRKKVVYDAMLVDEAQDLPPAFLQLCYALLKKPKRLVYAYDELQRLSGESMPSPEALFGKKTNGKPQVSLDTKQDIVLRTCYRNSRPILITAHAIGFGIYRRPPKTIIHRRRTGTRYSHQALGLVQMFDQANLWLDVGYIEKEGALADGQEIVLRRDSDTSPEFLENHSPIDDLVQFHVFEDENEQARWIVAEIEKNIKHDGLRHDDIVVINTDPLTTRKKTGAIRARLLERGIDCHLAGVDTDRDTFFMEDYPSITLSGVPRAKGNEAAMVYVVNSQAGIAGTYNVAGVRNRLFAAITRSKAWVRVAGVGPDMKELKSEYEKLVENDFELRFRYPTSSERAEIRTIHRDVSPQQQAKRNRTNSDLKEVIRSIKRGECSVEDIDPKVRHEFLSIFGEGSDAGHHIHAD